MPQSNTLSKYIPEQDRGPLKLKPKPKPKSDPKSMLKPMGDGDRDGRPHDR